MDQKFARLNSLCKLLKIAQRLQSQLISLLIKPTHSDAGSITLTIDLRLDKLSLDHTAKMYKFH